MGTNVDRGKTKISKRRKRYEYEDKKEFITQYGSSLLLNAFKNNEYQQLEYLLSEEQIKENFLSYIKGTISSAEIS